MMFVSTKCFRAREQIAFNWHERGMGQKLLHCGALQRRTGAHVHPNETEKCSSAVEALREPNSNFLVVRKIHVSAKWGFTRFKKDDFKKWKGFGRLIPNGTDVQWLSSRGPLHRLSGKQ